MGFLDCDERTVREKRTFSTVMCFKHSRGGKKNTASDRNLLVSPPARRNPGSCDSTAEILWWNQCTAYSFHLHYVHKMHMESVTFHTSLVSHINNALGLSK